LSLGLFTNPVMVGVIVLVLGLQVIAVYAPFVSTTLLRVQPLGATEWLLVVSAGVAMLLATETEKWWDRRAAGTAQRLP
jgi:Ca2+-transporting ATPase